MRTPLTRHVALAAAIAASASIASAAPTRIAVPVAPRAVVAMGDDLWVLGGDSPTLVRISARSGQQVGDAVPLGAASDPTYPTAPSWTSCCTAAPVLSPSASGVWSVDVTGSAFVHVAPTGMTNTVTRVPVAGVPRDVHNGVGLVDHTPSGSPGVPWAANALVRLPDVAAAPVTISTFDPVTQPGNRTIFGTDGPMELIAGPNDHFWTTRAAATGYPVYGVGTGDPAALTPLPSSVQGTTLARQAAYAYALGPYANGGAPCTITQFTLSTGATRSIPGRWASGGTSSTRCRVRAVAAAAPSQHLLWMVLGNIRPGSRGRVVRVSTTTGRLVGRAITVGTDPVAIAASGRGAWVADGSAHTLTRIN